MLLRIFTIIVLVMSLIACTSMQKLETTNHAAEIQQHVQPGDSVRITRQDESEIEFIVEAVDEETIAGEGHIIHYDEIVAIKSEQIDIGENVAVAVGGVVAYGVYAFISIMGMILAII